MTNDDLYRMCFQALRNHQAKDPELTEQQEKTLRNTLQNFKLNKHLYGNLAMFDELEINRNVDGDDDFEGLIRWLTRKGN